MNIRGHTPPSRFIIFLVGCLLTIQFGCTNLSAIREFADISAESAEYTKLVDEYATSPERQKRYQPASHHQQLADMALERSIQKDRLLLRHALIEEYMDALGQLAADELVTYDKDIDALGTAVVKNRIVDKKEAEAFGTIAKILTNAVTDHWRKSQLKKLISKTNDSFQTVVQALRTIVSRDFMDDLDIERIALNKYYTTKLLESSDPAGIAALQEWQELQRDRLKARQEALEGFAQALDNIAEGHQLLYDSQNDLATDGLMKQMSRHSKNLRKLINAIKVL